MAGGKSAPLPLSGPPRSAVKSSQRVVPSPPGIAKVGVLLSNRVTGSNQGPNTSVSCLAHIVILETLSVLVYDCR